MNFYLIAVMVFGADRLSKYLVAGLMEPVDSIPLLPGIFHLTYIQNRGAAFGIFQGQTIFFTLITLIVAVALLWVQKRFGCSKTMLGLSLGAIFGGALGNLWDRMLFGYVVDMFDFRVWPVFNVADSAIVVGVIILGWFILREPGLLEGEKQGGSD